MALTVLVSLRADKRRLSTSDVTERGRKLATGRRSYGAPYTLFVMPDGTYYTIEDGAESADPVYARLGI